jgi:hypothetical protein
MSRSYRVARKCVMNTNSNSVLSVTFSAYQISSKSIECWKWNIWTEVGTQPPDYAFVSCIYMWILSCCGMWRCVLYSLTGGHQIPRSLWVITEAPPSVHVLLIVETIKVGPWRSQKTINGAAELWLRARILDEWHSNSTTSFCQWNVCSPT